jgi:hypothetical protein
MPDPPAPGRAKHRVPRDLAERLARFHLINTACGTTYPFPRLQWPGDR